MGVVDLPQPVWGYIFLGAAAALIVALWLTDPRRPRRRTRHGQKNE